MAATSTSPTLTVLLPVRDAAGFVGRAVRSVLRSTLQDLEVLLLDDGSRDGSSLAALEAASGDPRLRILSLPRRGLAPALNAGLAASRGRYLARMDADDVCAAERFERQVVFLEAHREVGICGTRIRVEPEPMRGSGLWRYVTWQNSLLSHEEMERERFVESVLTHATAVFRRDVLDALGGWREAPWPEDYDLWLRGFAAGVRFGKLPDVLYEWHIRAGSTTWSDPRCRREALLACKVHYLKAVLAHAQRLVVWSWGRALEEWQQALGPGPSYEAVHPGRLRTLPGKLPGECFLFCYSSPGVRGRLRTLAASSGWAEGRDFLVAA